jgi:predicted permease
VLARQLNGDEALASTIIVLSSLMTLPVMAVVLAVTA